MAAPAEIVRLVETFERNKDAYRQGGLNETQLRREFLDPFFKTLGWDVDNTRGWAEPYKEVIHEDARSEVVLCASDRVDGRGDQDRGRGHRHAVEIV